MVCDLCKENEAVIFLEAIGKNGKRKINLCTQCAMARGIQAPVSAPNSENLAAVFKEIEEKEELRDSNSKKLCPICGKSLYSIFEAEFGRPLSPIEMETLIMWLEEDRYSVELIQLALREAVLSQVYNFKYIDRILLNWEKKNIRTKEQVEKDFKDLNVL